jgi:hypothetical protein
MKPIMHEVFVKKRKELTCLKQEDVVLKGKAHAQGHAKDELTTKYLQTFSIFVKSIDFQTLN